MKLKTPPRALTSSNITYLVSHSLRVFLILWFQLLSTHFVYVGAISADFAFLLRCSVFDLVCVGGFAILSFSIMYSATYRATQLVAWLDGFKAWQSSTTLFSLIPLKKFPQPVPYPTCLAHVYSYAECWRLFDVGIYVYMKRFHMPKYKKRSFQFLIPFFRYMYQPVAGRPVPGGRWAVSLLRKVSAFVVVYLFVWLYHGSSEKVFWWVAFNGGQVLLEATLTKAASTSETLGSVTVIKEWRYSF